MSKRINDGSSSASKKVCSSQVQEFNEDIEFPDDDDRKFDSIKFNAIICDSIKCNYADLNNFNAIKYHIFVKNSTKCYNFANSIKCYIFANHFNAIYCYSFAIQ
jgi:hypothetical protein